MKKTTLSFNNYYDLLVLVTAHAKKSFTISAENADLTPFNEYSVGGQYLNHTMYSAL